MMGTCWGIVTRAILFSLLVHSASADEGFDPAIVHDCLTSSDPSNCIAAGAQACLNTQQASSTAGVGLCFSNELEIWDAELNRAYGDLQAAMVEFDEDIDAIGRPLLRPTETLRDAQRAWIAWRDLQCRYVHSTFMGGTGGGPASAECALHLTAEQALRLRAAIR